MPKQPVDPKFNADRAGKWRTGNEGRLHPGMKHQGYWTRAAYFARKQEIADAAK